MKITDLNAGSMTPMLLAHPGGPRDAQGRPYLVTRVLLLESPETGPMLIDSGYGIADSTRPLKGLGPGYGIVAGAHLTAADAVAHQLEARGIQPGHIRHILITHLDLDHAGGLRDFPNATIHVHARELKAATERSRFTDQQRYKAHHLTPQLRWQPWETPGEPFFGLPSGTIAGLPDRIRWVDLPGHSAGHCGIAVQLDDGRWAFHVGDAVLIHNELLYPTSPLPVAVRAHHAGFDNDREAARRTRAALSTLLTQHRQQWVVFNGHDPRPIGAL
jgi:glyoxylase-like metal-dependent hydrolase (beta-lactamase superfamily II)